MGDATLTYLILEDKCTCEVTFNGKTWYLVYGGKYCRIISELCEIMKKDRKTIWGLLNRRTIYYDRNMKEKQQINYPKKHAENGEIGLPRKRGGGEFGNSACRRPLKEKFIGREGRTKQGEEALSVLGGKIKRGYYG